MNIEMKTNKEDAAFGFAAELSRSEDVYEHGLTKRELFAAMAMQGMLASETSSYNYGTDECLAENAVKKADSLINELNKK